MAEFPGLGSHCDVTTCNRLDFLPIKCDSCTGSFCTEHFSYDGHNCENSYRKNIQVPVCPICSQPVPTPKGVAPDYQVNEHIQNNCEQIKKQAVYKNKCSIKGCRKKELIPVVCPTCKLNYCLRHRHEKDHKCDEIMAQRKPERSSYLSNAMAALSMTRNTNCSSQARQTNTDEQLARALQQEEYENRSRTSRNSNNNGCSVS